MSVIGIVFGFFDRWFLQVIYGSVSQGFYSLAFSLSSIAGLFLAPMTPLLMQSIAKSDENNDIIGMRSAFDKVKILYLIAAFLTIFFMFHTHEILSLIGGDEYNGAQLTLLVLFLYPLHVVYGQFCGSVLIATRKTKVYRNIALISMLIGIIISYFLLAPKSFIIPGLGLGSLGLAIKLVVIQLVSVTLQLYFVCKYFNQNIFNYLLPQILIPIPVVLIGACELFIRTRISFILEGPLENGLSLAASMILWFIVMGSILWQFPGMVGLKKSVLKGTLNQLITAFRSKVR
jgi:O-antigen/teichoic acid export membrane protein